MDPNKTQIGGDHYKSDFQHWDLVCGLNLHYLTGNATKYVTRYKNKNGLQDLEKAKHYIQKAKKKNIPGCGFGSLKTSMIKQFIEFNKLSPLQASVLEDTCYGKYDQALYHLDGLIDGMVSRQSRIDNTGQEHPFGYDEKEEG